ncbi:MAG: hypothetical protein K8S18_13995, partial [Desulfobacula sp.]|nr:hypothetical protein [Desulfobacula sp.]
MKSFYLFFIIFLTSLLFYVAPVNSQDGYSLDFDGNGDYVALPYYCTTSGQYQQLSVCAWIRLYGDGGGWSVLDLDRSEYFNLEVGGN